MENKYYPEVTVNNSKEKKMVDVEGVQQEVEIPAQEGFNIKTKNVDGSFDKKFFTKELEGVILLDRYVIQSKYGEKDSYFSNEFEFSGPRNKLRVYSPSLKTVVFEGDYQQTVQHFSTGEMNDFGKPIKTFDVFSVLYILIGGEVFRFKQKMNKNNNWFKYKEGVDNLYSTLTKLSLDKKKVGSIEFWSCTLQNVGEAEDATQVAKDLELELDGGETKETMPQLTTEEEEINIVEPDDEIKVDNIPF